MTYHSKMDLRVAFFTTMWRIVPLLFLWSMSSCFFILIYFLLGYKVGWSKSLMSVKTDHIRPATSTWILPAEPLSIHNFRSSRTIMMTPRRRSFWERPRVLLSKGICYSTKKGWIWFLIIALSKLSYRGAPLCSSLVITHHRGCKTSLRQISAASAQDGGK